MLYNVIDDNYVYYRVVILSILIFEIVRTKNLGV